MTKYKQIWTKYNKHGMIIIDQNVNINDQRQIYINKQAFENLIDEI